MSGSCAANYAQEAFVSGMLHYVDCQAQSIGLGGYQSLIAPQSGFALILGCVLTIAIALFGIRIAYGHALRLRDVVHLVIKIGIVLTLATSWIAYRTVIYDVTMRGPAEIANVIGGGAEIPGASGDLTARLQQTDLALIDLGKLGVGRKALLVGNANANGQQGAQAGGANGQGQAPFNAALAIDRSLDIAADANALRSMRTSFLVGTVGVIAAIRLFAGLLLALGPFFGLCLLFDGTRAVFTGWLAMLAWTILASFGTTLIIGAELSFLDPWLAGILALRQADLPSGASPSELMAFTLIFAAIVIAFVIAAGFVSRTGLIVLHRTWTELVQPTISRHEGTSQSLLGAPMTSVTQRSRALTVSDAAMSLQRREVAYSSTASRTQLTKLDQRSESRQTLVSETMGLARRGQNAGRRRNVVAAQRRDRQS